MAMVIALAVEFHVHVGAPGEPELGIAGGEIDRTIVDEEVILRELKPGNGIAKFGFYSEYGKVGAGDPDASIDGDLVGHGIFTPLADSRAFAIALFLEADLPRGLAADTRESFASVGEVGAIVRL